MGNQQKKQISFITLNFSTIVRSPFQFFSEEQYQRQFQLSRLFYHKINEFKENLSQQNKKEYQIQGRYRLDDPNDKFDWNVGKIDRLFQTGRYTPLYSEKVGLKNSRFVSESQFKQIWWHFVYFSNSQTIEKNQFEKQLQKYLNLEQKSKIKQKNKLTQYFQKYVKITEEQYLKYAQHMLQFDLLVYKTILIYLYGSWNTKLEDIIDQVNDSKNNYINRKDPARYQQFMSNIFSKAFLSDKKKVDVLKQGLFKTPVDIVFLQQVDKSIFQKHIKSQQDQFRINNNLSYYYGKYDSSQTLILIKKSSPLYQFLQKRKQSEIQDSEKWIWDLQKKQKINRSIIQFSNVLLFSIHLKPSQIKNQKQTRKIIKIFNNLIKDEKYKQYIIIAGGDFNNHNFKISQPFKIYPQKKEEYTTNKQRTFIQCQYYKSQQKFTKRNDLLISNVEFQFVQVCTIEQLQEVSDLKKRKKRKQSKYREQNQSIKQLYLPNNSHPYDHFIVYGEIDAQIFNQIHKK